MRLLRSIVVSGMIFLMPVMVFAQNHPDEQDTNVNMFDKDVIESNEAGSISQQKLDIKSNKPLDFKFFTGTDFLFSKGYGSAGSFHFGANAFYPVTPRFTMEFGTTLSYTRLTCLPPGFFPENNLSEPALNATSVTLYTRGHYFLSSRLTLSGMAFKRFSPYKYPVINPNFVNTNLEGMSFGLNYRLFENFHVGAQFNFIRNNSPFYPSRLSQSVLDNYYW
jgi:hypothetical protein